MERGERLRTAVFYWVGFASVLAALAFVLLTIAGLQDDLKEANKARNALVDQVRELGGKPVVGPAGKAGQKGDKGDPGNPGTNGINGQNGTDGKDGSNGADGTEGAAGKDGKDGATGPQGEKGDTGPKGDTGAQGPQGEKGADGQTCPDGFTLGPAIVTGHNALVCIQNQGFGKG